MLVSTSRRLGLAAAFTAALSLAMWPSTVTGTIGLSLTCEQRHTAKKFELERKCRPEFPNLAASSDCAKLCKVKSSPGCLDRCSYCKSLRDDVAKDCSDTGKL